jgi:protein-S-isoprenylcysteine O-methyltransferase Ste14
MRLEHRIPPPLVALGLALVMWMLAASTPVLTVPSPLRWAVAGVLVAAGLGLELAGVLAFRRARTTVNPLRPERARQLVIAGVFRYTRNPMYVGLCLQLLGWAAFLAAPLALAGPVAFIGAITRWQIVPEERALHRIFGDYYGRYCQQVPRWL